MLMRAVPRCSRNQSLVRRCSEGLGVARRVGAWGWSVGPGSHSSLDSLMMQELLRTDDLVTGIRARSLSLALVGGSFVELALMHVYFHMYSDSHVRPHVAPIWFRGQISWTLKVFGVGKEPIPVIYATL